MLPALTIFLSAFLLFQVQPLMGKYLLPWFGGGPGVWTTCLLFFQTLLLGGYAYAHCLTKLAPRRQALIHLVLLVVAVCFVPVIPSADWKPVGGAAPLPHILALLAATVGVPYLALAATGPLVQRWFSLTRPGTSPWRLYALSNAGSLIALVSFPFVFEPLASRTTLAWAWSGGLVVFAVLCGILAWRIRNLSSTTTEPAAEPATSNRQLATASDRLLWFVLPAIASLLLVAVTNKICLDIAAVPFLWVLPLAVYLLTFILCFDHPRWYSPQFWSALLVAGCGGTAICLSDATIGLPVVVTVYVTTLLAAGMMCHGELYRRRPAASGLTGYYLTVAAGGAAGSLFVSLGAPLLFADYRELQVGLVLALYFTGIVSLLYRERALAVGSAIGALAITLLVPALQAESGISPSSWFVSWGRRVLQFQQDNWIAITAVLVILVVALRGGRRVPATDWHRRMCAVPLLLSVLLGVVFVIQARKDGAHVFAAARNFYGAYKIHVYNENDLTGRCYVLSHGGITHGIQFRHYEYVTWPTTYYGATSGAGRALDTAPGERRIGLVGLGAGTLATYGRPGDVFRFYDIDPAIVGVAQEHFSYLRRSTAKIDIVLGDARLSLEDELRRGQPGNFDVLLLDAFAGDAIPVHLLTTEAVSLYLAHLKPGGILAVHISNRHLDLRPVVEALARAHGLHFATISDTADKKNWWIYNTTWVLLSADPARLAVEDIREATEEPPDETAKYVLWTDDHASLFSILK